jgi:hypothetical protein
MKLRNLQKNVIPTPMHYVASEYFYTKYCVQRNLGFVIKIKLFCQVRFAKLYKIMRGVVHISNYRKYQSGLDMIMWKFKFRHLTFVLNSVVRLREFVFSAELENNFYDVRRVDLQFLRHVVERNLEWCLEAQKCKVPKSWKISDDHAGQSELGRRKGERRCLLKLSFTLFLRVQRTEVLSYESTFVLSRKYLFSYFRKYSTCTCTCTCTFEGTLGTFVLPEVLPYLRRYTY